MSSKITLRGRPGPIQKQRQYVAFTIKTQSAPANLPKGLPTLRGETKYLVLVTEKQWSKVERQINDNKDDNLHIEGFSTVQTDFPGVVILAQSISTAGMMSARKKQQKAESQGEDEE